MTEDADPRLSLLLALADDELIIGHRHAEWTGWAPHIEEDLAFSSIAQDELAHARLLYGLVGAMTGQGEDELAFGRAPAEYRNAVLPAEAKQDLMFVMSGTRRMWPLRNVGSLTDEYSLTSDWDNQWLTGGMEPEVIMEAHLDRGSIFSGIQRFANDRESRMARQRALLSADRD